MAAHLLPGVGPASRCPSGADANGPSSTRLDSSAPPHPVSGTKGCKRQPGHSGHMYWPPGLVTTCLTLSNDSSCRCFGQEEGALLRC